MTETPKPEPPQKLPCDVHLPPATYIRKGCSISALFSALKVREDWEDGVTFPRSAPQPEPWCSAKWTGGQAVIQDGLIVISVAIADLPSILEGSIGERNVKDGYRVSDPATFAKEVCRELNAEDERGNTHIHRMFDTAFDRAIDHGAEGVEPVKDSDLPPSPWRDMSTAPRDGEDVLWLIDFGDDKPFRFLGHWRPDSRGFELVPPKNGTGVDAVHIRGAKGWSPLPEFPK